jgi:hypothetical protein
MKNRVGKELAIYINTFMFVQQKNKLLIFNNDSQTSLKRGSRKPGCPAHMV